MVSINFSVASLGVLSLVSAISDPVYSDSFGGNGGKFFDDGRIISDDVYITDMMVSGGKALDSVAITYSDGSYHKHGHSGGKNAYLHLKTGETWDSIEICKGRYDGYERALFAAIKTNLGNVIYGGHRTIDCWTIYSVDGYSLIAFYGHSGRTVDRLGAVYKPNKTQ